MTSSSGLPTSPPAPDALTCRREDFRLRPGAPYLNCAYMGPLPRRAEDAGVAALARKRHPSDITAPDAFWECDALRASFARLIGADDPARVAIQPGVSYGVATAARNLRVARGQNIVLTHEQFPGNVYGWRALAEEVGAVVRMVAPPQEPAGRGAIWNERLLEAVDRSTAIVSVPHVHWTDGTRFDLAELGHRCRRVGAALVIDGTQSIGALPLDVGAIRPDAVVCATYKWLLGPYALALAWYGPRFDEGRPLEETWIARRGSRDFQGLVDYEDAYEPGAARYDMAERSNFFLVPIAQASLGLLHQWRPERVQEYCRELTREFLEEARELGFTVESEEWRGSHLFGLRMPAGVELATLRDLLAAREIAVSLRGSALRVSPNVYNDEEDVRALARVLREVVG